MGTKMGSNQKPAFIYNIQRFENQLKTLAPSAGLPDVKIGINFSPSPKCKKPTTFVAGFGSLCWARTSDPLINPARAGL